MFFLIFLFLCVAVTAKESVPWLTGPLIAPVGQVIPYGDFLLKTYFFAKLEKPRAPLFLYSDNSHFYSVIYESDSFFGLTPWADFNIVPRVIYNRTAHEQSLQPGDLKIGLDVQLLSPNLTPYFPGIKLAIRENFPTGKFEYLSPKKLRTDQTGQGTYATQFDLIFYKVFHLYKLHWLSFTWSNQCTIPTPVSVHHFNAYGGGFGTKGVVLPGNEYTTILSFELTLNRYFALAFDNEFTLSEASRFYGFPGISFEGTYATVGLPYSAQANFALSLEANFSSHFGVIFGTYFSTFGENVTSFRSLAININYLY